MPDFAIEDSYNNRIIAGIDEAGRGPFAGPVVAGAVIIDRNNVPSGIDDSKKLSMTKREELFELITRNHIWAVGIVEAAEIDQINILQATIKACYLAAAGLSKILDIVLVDGNMRFTDSRFKSIIKGDNLSISIAAASIIAKVYRDRLMKDLAMQFPEYLWHKNSGYGTKEHKTAIEKYGLTSQHRKSFKFKTFSM